MEPYHDVTSFNDLVVKNSCFHEKGLKLFHINAQSLRNKQADIETYLSQLNCCFDFLAFSETWYAGEYDVIHFSGYKHISIYRSRKRGGGVSLYARECHS